MNGWSACPTDWTNVNPANIVLTVAFLGAGAHCNPVPPSYRGTTIGQRRSSAPGPLPHLSDEAWRTLNDALFAPLTPAAEP